MKAASVEGQAIQQHCKLLRLPTVGGQFQTLAEQATREKRTHIGYLEGLLSAEVEDRERRTIERRLKEARLPRIKALEEFDFAESKKISAAEIAQLAKGEYIDRSEPVLLIGDCGTGKTHLMTGLCVAACRQKRRVRFTTAAALVQRTGRGQATTAVEPGAQSLVALRADCDRRGRLCTDGEPAVFGMDEGHPERQAMQKLCWIG